MAKPKHKRKPGMNRVKKERMFLKAIADGIIQVDSENGIIIGQTGVPVGQSRTGGYGVVNLRVGDERASLSPHRLVYLARHGEPLEDDTIIAFKDGDSGNFRYSNLEAMDQAEFRRMAGTRSKGGKSRAHPLAPVINPETGIDLLEGFINAARARTAQTVQPKLVRGRDYSKDWAFTPEAVAKLREYFAKSKGKLVSVAAIAEAFDLGYETVRKLLSVTKYQEIVTPYDDECKAILRALAANKIKPLITTLPRGSARRDLSRLDSTCLATGSIKDTTDTQLENDLEEAIQNSNEEEDEYAY